MLKIIKITSLCTLVLLLLTGCMSKSQQKAIYYKAVPLGQQYMKDNFNADVIFSDNYKFLDPMSSDIILYGHMVGDEDATFSIIINHETFKVNDVGGSSKVMDRYIKPDQKNKPSTEDPKK